MEGEETRLLLLLAADAGDAHAWMERHKGQCAGRFVRIALEPERLRGLVVGPEDRIVRTYRYHQTDASHREPMEAMVESRRLQWRP